MRMTLDELRAHALRTGAELIVDGKHFNSARAQIDVKPIRPAPPPAIAVPAPAAVPEQANFTRADVERLLDQAEARFQQQLLMLTQMVQRDREVDDDAVPVDFTPKYNSDGALTGVHVNWQRMQ